MPSRNTVLLMGHLGQDAETKYTPNGNACTTFSLATTRSYKDKAGEWQEQTDWHRVVAWNLHEKVAAQLEKGHLVDVEGRLQTRSFEKDGATHYRTEVIAQRVNYLRPPFRSGPRDADVPADARPPRASEDPQPANGGHSLDDDNIPF